MPHDKEAFVVIAEFTVRPGAMETFLDALREDARASLANEPGCRYFDVIAPNDAPDRVVLYEVYDDAAAFENHRAQPHYAAFTRARDAHTVGTPIIRLGTRVG